MKNKTITFSECRFPEDVRRLSNVCVEQGFYPTPYQLQEAWEDYSEGMCASWLILGDDEEIFEAIRPYL